MVNTGDEKVSLFVKFEKILHVLCFLLDPPYKYALQEKEFYEKIMERFQDLSKAKNPTVSEAKV